MLCSLFRGEGEAIEDEDVMGEARAPALPLLAGWLGVVVVGTLEGLRTDSGLVLEWEDEGERWEEAGEVGGC